MSSPRNPRDLAGIFHERSLHHGPRFQVMTEVEDAIRGRLPDRYEGLFNEKEVRMEIRTIRTADDDLTGACKKVFPIEVRPYGEAESRKKAAEKVEKVAYGWNNGAAMIGGPEMEATMHDLARHQVRFMDGCLVVHADFEKKVLFFQVRDPRHHLPPVGWTPTSISPLDETLIAYRVPLGMLRRQYPEHAEALNRQYRRSIHTGVRSSIPSDDTICHVGEFYSKAAEYVATLDDGSVVLAGSEDGDRMHPGVCRVTSFMQPEADPLFAGQIPLEIAASKVLGQEIQSTDQMLHGPVFHSPLIGGDMRWDEPNIFSTANGEKPLAMRLAPNSPANTERVLGTIVGLSRVYNRNPESFQGGGDANSGKAIRMLQAGPRTMVQEILWAPFIAGFPRVYDTCVNMELNLWPKLYKKAFGLKGSRSFEVDYIPEKHLEGYQSRIKIERGYGLGGYEQTLDGLQRMGGDALSLQTFMEMASDIRDAHEEIRRIESERLGKLMWATLEAKAQTLSPAGLAAIKEKVDDGTPLFDAIREVSEAGVLEQIPPEAEVPVPGVLPPGMAPPDMGIPPSLVGARGF